MARQRGPARICRGYGGRRLASAVAAVAAHAQALAEAAPCSVDCVCEESGGGGESWDLSPISGTYTTTDGDEREYWLDVCGNIDAVPELCLESTPTIDAAMVMRTDGSFCNQMGPSFADLPSDDLVVAAAGDGARFVFAHTSQASGQRRTLTLSLLCDPEATGSSPNEAVCDDDDCNDVSVDWLTAAVCRPGFPPSPPPPWDDSPSGHAWPLYLAGSLGLVVCVSSGGYAWWHRGGEPAQHLFNKAPGMAQITPSWSKREKKKKSSRHRKSSVTRKSEYEPIPTAAAAAAAAAAAVSPMVSSAAVKAASKDQIGLLREGRLRGEDRYPKKSDLRRWSEAKQQAEAEAEAEAEILPPERTAGLGRRGGRLTMGAEILCEIEAVPGSKRKGRSWGRKHKQEEEKPRPSLREPNGSKEAAWYASEGAPFVASPKFIGARRGYEYKYGALGVGYYKQRPAQSAVL